MWTQGNNSTSSADIKADMRGSESFHISQTKLVAFPSSCVQKPISVDQAMFHPFLGDLHLYLIQDVLVISPQRLVGGFASRAFCCAMKVPMYHSQINAANQVPICTRNNILRRYVIISYVSNLAHLSHHAYLYQMETLRKSKVIT